MTGSDEGGFQKSLAHAGLFIGQDLSISPAWQVIFFLSVHKEGVAVVVLAKSCFVLACMLFVDTSGGLTHVGYVLSHTPQGME